MTVEPEHYTRYTIEPKDYIRENGLGWHEGNVVKYISRHDKKDGLKDIRKAIQYCEYIMEEYLNGHEHTVTETDDS